MVQGVGLGISFETDRMEVLVLSFAHKRNEQGGERDGEENTDIAAGVCYLTLWSFLRMSRPPNGRGRRVSKEKKGL